VTRNEERKKKRNNNLKGEPLNPGEILDQRCLWAVGLGPAEGKNYYASRQQGGGLMSQTYEKGIGGGKNGLKKRKGVKLEKSKSPRERVWGV